MTYLFQENSFDRHLRDATAAPSQKPDGLILYEQCTHWPKWPAKTVARTPGLSIPRPSSGGGQP